MLINEFPREILSNILEIAAELNAKDNVSFTYGLSQAPLPLQTSQLSRYVRGPVSPETLRWDATSILRRVCPLWHDWALEYALEHVYIRRWRGSERWAELSTKRKLYSIYELIEKPSGYAVYRDPYASLRETSELFSRYPALTDKVRRIWFNGFFTAESEALIFKVLRSCRYLTTISIPWTLLRHGDANDWMHLLGIADAEDMPVQSLELHAVCLPEATTSDSDNMRDLGALSDPRVNFSHLKRLKLIGNTTFMPVNDRDLEIISQSATNIEELHVVCLSTVSINGVMAIVKGAQSTIRVIEHSPRSNDGFYHPDPGQLESGEHICDILTNCPKLRDLSISVPSMCAHLFSNENVLWDGECQVRAMGLCADYTLSRQTTRQRRTGRLQKVLDQARDLMASQERRRRTLDIELFFANCIFDPKECVVDGDFALAEISSGGQWPAQKAASSKGPYGSTGLYGKEEGDWDVVSEEEYMRALENGWIRP